MPAKKITKAERVSRAIKSARVERGLTQTAVAKRFNVKQTAVSLWERDYTRMSVGNFEMLCKILHIEPGEILSIKEVTQ